MIRFLSEALRQRDKVLHFIAGAVIAVAVAVLAVALVGVPLPIAGLLGFAAAVAAGIGKEVWDRYNPPRVEDAADAWVTMIGGAAGLLAALLVSLLVAVATPPAKAQSFIELQVLDHRCDDKGAVTALLIEAPSAGVGRLGWRNAVVCGQPS